MTRVASLAAYIGEVSSERRGVFSEKEMRAFADCVHATRGNTSHSQISTLVAPTFFTLFRGGEFELLSKFGIELKEVLHAEQEYELQGPLGPNEEIRYVTTLTSVVEKRGKDVPMAFLLFETPVIRVSDSVELARAKSTIVFRDTSKGGARA